MLWHSKSLILFPGDMRTEREGLEEGETSDGLQTFQYEEDIPDREEIDFIGGLFVYNNMTDILVREDIFRWFCRVNNHNLRFGEQSELDSKV